MTQLRSPLEFNSFTKGLITEASPLTFPDNASLDEVNFILNRDGSRRRRLGMDFEDSFTEVTTTSTLDSNSNVNTNTFRWSDASGDAANQIAVVQVGVEIKFFNLSSQPLSGQLIHTHTLSDSNGPKVQFANVSGLLVMAGDGKELTVFEYESSAVSTSSAKLQVRDFFGVEAIYTTTGDDLRDASYLGVRPLSNLNSDNHLYNLRNQGWATVSRIGNVDTLRDPLRSFRTSSSDIDSDRVYPSNKDLFSSALYPDPNDSDDRVGDRFWPDDLINNPDRLSESPRGSFIIDLFDRGTSRLQVLQDLYDRHPNVVFQPEERVGSLPLDTTSGVTSVVESFAGRLWSAGFSSTVTDGDKYSPRLSSYVMFSQLVKSISDVGRCYQQADPSSSQDSDIVATDGGFIRVDGAENIVSLRQVGNSLLVIATNGVWSIDGGSDTGFTATDYRVTKLSSSGSESYGSVVDVEESVMYWSSNGIYMVGTDQLGSLSAESITSNTIQRYYQNITYEGRVSCKGIYDRFERKVRWLYNNTASSTGSVKELIFDLDLQAFYVLEISRPDQGLYVSAPLEMPPYVVGQAIDNIIVGVDNVVVGADNVVVTSDVGVGQSREVAYLTIISTSPTISFTFSTYRDNNFQDWVSSEFTAQDSPARLLTGYISGGDFQRFKQVQYLTAHFKRTEDGFGLDVEGNPTPTSPSSCMLSAQWDWANSSSSGKWSNPKQAYRYRRHYIPNDVADDYDYGFDTIVSKNRIRGRGRVVSFLFETEPLKDCQILGWSLVLGANRSV